MMAPRFPPSWAKRRRRRVVKVDRSARSGFALSACATSPRARRKPCQRQNLIDEPADLSCSRARAATLAPRRLTGSPRGDDVPVQIQRPRIVRHRRHSGRGCRRSRAPTVRRAPYAARCGRAGAVARSRGDPEGPPQPNGAGPRAASRPLRHPRRACTARARAKTQGPPRPAPVGRGRRDT